MLMLTYADETVKQSFLKKRGCADSSKQRREAIGVMYGRIQGACANKQMCVMLDSNTQHCDKSLLKKSSQVSGVSHETAGVGETASHSISQQIQMQI